MPIIRQLDSFLINQIAAGEVIERPASVIKELVENALDAGATHIHITFRQGGHTLIRVEDNGIGMDQEDLLACVQRHTTSKLTHDTLWSVQTFGFRGEALAAICSIARVTLRTCQQNQDHGWSFFIEGGQHHPLAPVPYFQGTSIEVKDMFFSTPARLKFLRSATVEQGHILDVIDRIALINPDVSFAITYDEKKRTYAASPDATQRFAQIVGTDFLTNAIPLESERDGYRLKGWIGLPTYHRATADRQYFFVNKRPIKDKILSMCLRTAYGDLMPRDRSAVAVLFLELPPQELDINVHPAKTEVRFRDIPFLKHWVLASLKEGLFGHSQRARSAPPPMENAHQDIPQRSFFPSYRPPIGGSFSRAIQQAPSFALKESDSCVRHLYTPPAPALVAASCAEALDLGQVLGQIQNRYILSHNAQGLVITDPHAAHERLLYERMKGDWGQSLGASQLLLMPASIPLTEAEIDTLAHHQDPLHTLGIQYTLDGILCHITALPTIFKDLHPGMLIKDLAEALYLTEDTAPTKILMDMRNRFMAGWACRQSVFLGTRIDPLEMTSLLRQIEATPHSAQCNHGRPVYRQISFKELDQFFERR